MVWKNVTQIQQRSTKTHFGFPFLVSQNIIGSQVTRAQVTHIQATTKSLIIRPLEFISVHAIFPCTKINYLCYRTSTLFNIYQGNITSESSYDPVRAYCGLIDALKDIGLHTF